MIVFTTHTHTHNKHDKLPIDYRYRVNVIAISGNFRLFCFGLISAEILYSTNFLVKNSYKYFDD